MPPHSNFLPAYTKHSPERPGKLPLRWLDLQRVFYFWVAFIFMCFWFFIVSGLAACFSVICFGTSFNLQHVSVVFIFNFCMCFWHHFWSCSTLLLMLMFSAVAVHLPKWTTVEITGVIKTWVFRSCERFSLQPFSYVKSNPAKVCVYLRVDEVMMTWNEKSWWRTKQNTKKYELSSTSIWSTCQFVLNECIH